MLNKMEIFNMSKLNDNVTYTKDLMDEIGRNISFEQPNESTKNCDDVSCLILVTLVTAITLLGILANSLVLVRVAWDPKLHTPTFVTLASLALADLLFLVFKYTTSVLMKHFPETFPTRLEEETYPLVLDSIGSTAGASSTMHILALYILRYISLIHPLQFYVYATVKRVFFVSFGIWIFCGSLISFYITFSVVHDKQYPLFGLIIHIVVTLILSFVPFLLILIIHFIKTAKLKRSVAAVRVEATRTMSRMVMGTVIVYLVTTTPANVRDILMLGFDFSGMVWYRVFDSVCHILVFVNFAVNPFIYLIISKLFRSSVRSCCSYLCDN